MHKKEYIHLIKGKGEPFWVNKVMNSCINSKVTIMI